MTYSVLCGQEERGILLITRKEPGDGINALYLVIDFYGFSPML
jgi:hypothetical protein